MRSWARAVSVAAVTGLSCLAAGQSAQAQTTTPSPLSEKALAAEQAFFKGKTHGLALEGLEFHVIAREYV